MRNLGKELTMIKLCVVLSLLALSHALGVPGGVSEVDLGSNQASGERSLLMDAAHWATERICQSSNSNVHLRLMRMVKATEQVVAGMKYVITMELGETNCLKSETDMSACLASPQPQPHPDHKLICTATVWSRPWLREPEKMILQGQPYCQDQQ